MTSPVRFLFIASILAIGAIAGSRISAQGQSAQAGPPQALPGQAAVVDGELEIQIEDWNGGSRMRHYLQAAGGRRFELQLGTYVPDLPSGTRVRAHGHVVDSATLALDAGTTLEALSAPAVPNTFGNQQTLVILVNFQNNAVQPYTAASANTVTFTDTSNFYLENSYRQTWLSGTVVGWYTIAMDNTTCDTNKIATLAEQAAANAGVNVASYPHRIFGFPQMSACGWWGLGNVGGSPSRAWINGTYSLKVVGHEFGHNLGDRHSRSQPCDTTGCTVVEYGDTHDIMGNPSSGHMNAYQKERLGWLGYGASPAIQIVNASGDYWIDGMSNAGVAPKALKIFKGTDASGHNVYHYIEARTNTGFDAGLASGVLVHAGTDGDPSAIYMLDLDPATTAFDGVLDAGQTFSDSASGLSVSTLWADSTGAMVRISLPGGSCTTSIPTVAVSPSTTVTTSPGATVNYSMTVTNTDTTACAPSSFSLSTLVPSGWTSGFSSGASMTLSPGQSGSTTFTVGAASNASGLYSIEADASRSGSKGAAVRSVNVIGNLTVALVTSEVRGQYTLTATVTAGGAPASGAGVTFNVISPAGAIKMFSATTAANGIATAKFKPAPKDPAGTYTVTAIATLGSVSGSANGTLTVR